MAENCSGSCSTCGSAGSCSERKPSRLDKVKHKIMVLSGKGGVGKSTVAAALAVSLAREGMKVALLDVDFHGPSQPTLFGVADQRLGGTEAGLQPISVAGVKLVSVGLLLENPDDAVILRGPAKIGLLGQLFEEVDWGTRRRSYSRPRRGCARRAGCRSRCTCGSRRARLPAES